MITKCRFPNWEYTCHICYLTVTFSYSHFYWSHFFTHWSFTFSFVEKGQISIFSKNTSGIQISGIPVKLLVQIFCESFSVLSSSILMFSSKFCSNVAVMLSVAISCCLVSSTDFFSYWPCFCGRKNRTQKPWKEYNQPWRLGKDIRFNFTLKGVLLAALLTVYFSINLI